MEGLKDKPPRSVLSNGDVQGKKTLQPFHVDFQQGLSLTYLTGFGYNATSFDLVAEERG
jgi:hypothetical protein